MKLRIVFTGECRSRKSKAKSSTSACAKYLLPPHRSLVDLEDVPEEKSSLSTQATFKPLVAASNAAPAPVAPPPITSTSNSCFAFNRDIIFALDGNNRVSEKGDVSLLEEKAERRGLLSRRNSRSMIRAVHTKAQNSK
jgi:hypothetical protein